MNEYRQSAKAINIVIILCLIPHSCEQQEQFLPTVGFTEDACSVDDVILPHCQHGICQFPGCGLITKALKSGLYIIAIYPTVIYGCAGFVFTPVI